MSREAMGAARALAAAALAAWMPAAGASSQGPPRSEPELFVEGLAAAQLDAGLDGGGRLSVSRLLVEPGLRMPLGQRGQLSLSFGYGLDDYRFSGASGLAGQRPWDAIETPRANAFLRWRASESWSVFAGLNAGTAAERGASLGDAWRAGALLGASWRASERLSIGPGLGVFSQIEDDPDLFPILLVDWRITDALSFRTGRGVGASRGPGLGLVWRPAERWELALGGRFERLRFRLDGSGPLPGGVGEQRSLALYVSASRALGARPAGAGAWGGSRIGLLAGVGLAGRLELADPDGGRVAREDFEPAPFFGLLLEL